MKMKPFFVLVWTLTSFLDAARRFPTVPHRSVDPPPPLSALAAGLLRVAPTGDGARGDGLFAVASLPAGTWLGDYEGEVLSLRAYVKRYPGGRDSRYTFLLNPDAQRRDRVYVDAADPTLANAMRYINHSRVAANVDSTVIKGTNVRLTANRDVAAGEELLMDYGPLYTPAAAWDALEAAAATSNPTTTIEDDDDDGNGGESQHP